MTEYIVPEMNFASESFTFDLISQLPQNLIDKINFNGPNGCWLWEGSLDSKEYGLVSWAKFGFYSNGSARRVPVHKVIYSELCGPIPDGYLIDHTCRNRKCCAPYHLRLATPKQNMENRNLGKNNTSGVTGVLWRESNQVWRARIGHHGKRYSLGDYESLEEAKNVVLFVKNKIFTHYQQIEKMDESVISPYGWGRIATILTELGHRISFD